MNTLTLSNQKMQKITLLSFLLLLACASPADTPQVPPKRYLALGDSYTIGQSVAENERFPNQLATLFYEKNIPVEVTIIARTGWTTDDLLRTLQASPPTATYDFVSLLIGVNNQYRGYSIDSYREEFRLLLKKSIEYTGGDPNRVIVLSIPDWGVTPFAKGKRVETISKEIDIFNAVNRAETESAGAHYVNITPISRQVPYDSSLIAVDGLHPSAKMYQLWVEETLPVTLEIFK